MTERTSSVRLAAMILILAGIAVSLVHIRRSEIVVRHEIQHLQMQRVSLRRTLWDQQVRIGYLTAPREIRRRMEQLTMKARDENQRWVQRSDDGE